MASVLVTGSSRGIGFDTCLTLARAGHTVFATMRSPERSPELGRIAAEEELPIHVSVMDVDSDESVRSCVDAILDEHGAVDALVNNAGQAPHGTFEEMPLSDIRGVMETNYVGALRCIRAVLPGMRGKGSGTIVNVSSVAGRLWCSPLGPYGASKAALEAMSEALAQEVRAFGVHVAIVEPGIIDTKLARDVRETGESIYPQPRRLANMFAASLRNPVPPELVAEKILEIVEGRAPLTGPEDAGAARDAGAAEGDGAGDIDGRGWQLRHPVGPDAAPFIGWRSTLTDEEWVEWWAEPDDDAWYDAVEGTFGLDARPEA